MPHTTPEATHSDNQRSMLLEAEEPPSRGGGSQEASRPMIDEEMNYDDLFDEIDFDNESDLESILRMQSDDEEDGAQQVNQPTNQKDQAVKRNERGPRLGRKIGSL